MIYRPSGGGTSVVKRDGDTIIKSVVRYNGAGIVAREVRALERLEGFAYFPSLIGVVGETITMTYVGEPVTAETLPSDADAQAAAIIEVMHRRGVHHNDIKPHDILVQDGYLRLIDFQWATFDGEPTPKDYPIGIGGRWKAYLDHPRRYNDTFSIQASLETIRGND